MMKTSNRIFFIGLMIGLSLLGSCKKSWACNEENISSSGGDDSHNKGMNCMQCHNSSGEGEGCFNVAGTVYQANLQNTVSSGKVELYTGPNGTGTLKYTIDIDSKGNFYTTANVAYTGLYPKVTGPSGASISMGSPLSTGACNSCHGASTAKIGID
ncbi:MAG: hypothetical protein RLZZ211_659 [Bacteroidota bacterium]|jgi:hypothetical protein